MQDECENDDYVVSLLAGLSPLMHWQWIIGTHVSAQPGRKQTFEVTAGNLLYGPARICRVPRDLPDDLWR